MVELENFSICNNFKTDNKGKGKLAEDDFIEYFYSNPKNNNKSLHKVTDNPDYQDVDIDFIIDNEGGKDLLDFQTVINNTERFTKVEVKYSGPALRTGKLAFEMISHSNFGWGYITKCDYIYTLFGENNPDGSYHAVKRGIIDFKKWESFIKDKKNRREIYVNKGENIIVNIMTYLNDMEKKGVLKFI